MGKIDSVAKKIADFVRLGNLSRAFEYISEISKDFDKETWQMVSIVEGRYRSIMREYHLGVLPNNDFQIYISKISYDLLSIVEMTSVEDKVDEILNTLHPYFNFQYQLPVLPEPNLDLRDNQILKKAAALYRFETNGILYNRQSKIDRDIIGDKKYLMWLSTKRKFIEEEINDVVAIKISGIGALLKLNLFSDGTIEESGLGTTASDFKSNDNTSWSGHWEIVEGILVINIDDKWHLHVFAYNYGVIHSGIEFDDYDNVFFHNVIILPFRDFAQERYKKSNENPRTILKIATKSNSIAERRMLGVMLNGDTIRKNEKIISENKRYYLSLNETGRLFIGEIDTNRTIWSSNNNECDAFEAKFKDDGNLVIYDKEYRIFWETKTSNKTAQLIVLQNDSVLEMYDSYMGRIWKT